ncbi:MAG: SAM-dependent chlorinase/fluorinase [candidate division WOR-3 bacterium]|nr:MAG: SAM-dependent chlorinase/fluorinase [candidate division WOR-3 bacterium]
MKVITFLSDFGTDDWFVAAVKGEILKINPCVRIVDITHDIKPYDVRGAAFVLFAVFRNFPKGSIHLAVVDPGVGGDRKPIIVRSQGQFFVGPDNGIFSRVYDASSMVYEIKVNSSASATFHARDIFGPTAARLSGGTSLSRLGKIHREYVVHETAGPTRRKNVIFGEIAYVDHFGNCITNIPNSEKITKLRVLGRMVNIIDYYSVMLSKGLAGVRGSLGYYEIARYKGNASQVLKAEPGMRVEGHE